MKHKVVLDLQFRSQARLRRKLSFRSRAICASAGSHETVDRGQFVMRAVGKQPRSDICVAMEFRQCVRCGAIAALARDVSTVPYQAFDHG